MVLYGISTITFKREKTLTYECIQYDKRDESEHKIISVTLKGEMHSGWFKNILYDVKQWYIESIEKDPYFFVNHHIKHYPDEKIYKGHLYYIDENFGRADLMIYFFMSSDMKEICMVSSYRGKDKELEDYYENLVIVSGAKNIEEAVEIHDKYNKDVDHDFS